MNNAFMQNEAFINRITNFLLIAAAVFLGGFLAISLTGANADQVGAHDTQSNHVAPASSASTRTVAANACGPTESSGGSAKSAVYTLTSYSAKPAAHGHHHHGSVNHTTNTTKTTTNTTTTNTSNNRSITNNNSNSGIGVQDVVDVNTGDILSNNETNVLNDSLNNNSVLNDNNVLSKNLNNNDISLGLLTSIL